MENQRDYAQLFTQYLNGELHERDMDALFVFLADEAHETEVRKLIHEHLEAMGSSRADLALGRMADQAGKRINEVIMVRSPLRRRVAWMAVAAVAAMVVLAGMIGWYSYVRQHTDEPQEVFAQWMPPDAGAVLTLADGREFGVDALDSTLLSNVAGRLSVKADSHGRLVFDELPGDGEESIQPESYTLSTRAGTTLHVVLPDGSAVQLNGSSRLVFPSVFSGPERKVRLDGEAFFDVAKVRFENEDQPFLVSAQDKLIWVLGTSFNVAAYADEPTVYTTLLTGKVGLSTVRDSRQTYLVPGQEATATVGEDQFYVRQVNVSQAAAWRNGVFVFDEEPLPQLLRTITRWYGVELDDTPFLIIGFPGSISRHDALGDVLAIIEKTGGLKFSRKGNTLMVKPQE